MFGSLIALVMLAAQPAPTEAPVEVEAEAEVQLEAPVADVAVQAEAQVEAQPAAEAETETAEAAPEEEVICRRRLRPSERIGQRHRVVQDCRPRSEWESARRRRGAED